MDYHYQMPSSIGLDDLMKAKSVLNLKRLNAQDLKKHVPKYAKAIVDHAKQLQSHYKTGHIPIFYGSDLSHENSEDTFEIAQLIMSEIGLNH